MYNHDEILKFIIDYKQRNDGNSPSLRAIQESCSISSTSVTKYLFDDIQAKGWINYLRNDQGRMIGIVVKGGEW